MMDLIERQAAIDAIKRMCKDYAFGKSTYHPHMDFVVEVLEELSSAQPEQAIKDCRNCNNGKYNDHYGIRFCYESDNCVDWNLWEPKEEPEIIRCKDCKHNPNTAWFGCPMAHLTNKQRPETAWCWKGERREDDE